MKDRSDPSARPLLVSRARSPRLAALLDAGALAAALVTMALPAPKIPPMQDD
jgi:hypothetical protein